MGSWRTHRDGDALGREAALRRLGLLIVDDEPNILDSLREVFKRYLTVYTAASAEEALRVMREHAPQIVLSDERMPGKTGLELMATLKELNPDSVRILLTGYSDIHVVVKALNEGLLYKYLTKPWEQAELTATVLAGANDYLRRSGFGGEAAPILGC